MPGRSGEIVIVFVVVLSNPGGSCVSQCSTGRGGAELSRVAGAGVPASCQCAGQICHLRGHIFVARRHHYLMIRDGVQVHAGQPTLALAFKCPLSSSRASIIVGRRPFTNFRRGDLVENS